jgi:Fe-S-cluster containining protein
MPMPIDNVPECAGCGRCCHLVVELVAGVDDDVPEHFVVEHDGLRCMEQFGDGACVALDPVTRLCSIYERRPEACRRLKRAESLCRMALSRYATFRPSLPHSA